MRDSFLPRQCTLCIQSKICNKYLNDWHFNHQNGSNLNKFVFFLLGTKWKGKTKPTPVVFLVTNLTPGNTSIVFFLATNLAYLPELTILLVWFWWMVMSKLSRKPQEKVHLPKFLVQRTKHLPRLHWMVLFLGPLDQRDYFCTY